MNGRYWPIGLSFMFALSGVCLADYPDQHGTIRIVGGIDESGCNSGPLSNAAFTLSDCPTVVRDTSIDIVSIDNPTAGITPEYAAAHVSLVSDSGSNSRYYNRQYEVLDRKGKLIRSGAYIITLTSP
ncbi:type 1 fimbrial protein [Pseudomonas sp. B329]|uniref:type 1 fimbrial protein n=1 Tax=Pseudomonas sp. B329 TaxID=1553459 RepID=UPI0020031F41|nr:type 1 fimbrial protein [Pseudomonas sp. B329]MCK3863815.1 type 1 fimbrial protein [Pseudomonas sp. B329]